MIASVVHGENAPAACPLAVRYHALVEWKTPQIHLQRRSAALKAGWRLDSAASDKEQENLNACQTSDVLFSFRPTNYMKFDYKQFQCSDLIYMSSASRFSYFGKPEHAAPPGLLMDTICTAMFYWFFFLAYYELATVPRACKAFFCFYCCFAQVTPVADGEMLLLTWIAPGVNRSACSAAVDPPDSAPLFWAVTLSPFARPACVFNQGYQKRQKK